MNADGSFVNMLAIRDDVAVRLRRFRNHTQQGTYCVLSDDPCVARAHESPASRQAAAGARFCMATPAVQSPLTHWIGNFYKKAQIDDAYAAPGGVPTLLALLQEAIVAREPEATQYAWWNIKKRDCKTHLGLAHLSMDTPVVHFLLFCAQVPDLFCGIVYQHARRADWHGGGAGRCEQHLELVPLVAALMDALHYVKRVSGPSQGLCSDFAADVLAHDKEREYWDEHDYSPSDEWWHPAGVTVPPGPDHDTWWHRALTMLIAALPLWPTALNRYVDTQMCGDVTSLLERAALCSELSLAAFESILTHCEFSQTEVSRVLITVLYRGNIRAPTEMIRVATRLYAHLWHTCAPSEAPLLKIKHLNVAWGVLFMASTEQRLIALNSTSAKCAFVETYQLEVMVGLDESICEQMGKIRVDAAHYEKLGENFLSVHANNMSRKGHEKAMRAVCLHAMTVGLQLSKDKTYLVELLLRFARDHEFLGDFFKTPFFLRQILTHHVACWDEYLKDKFCDMHAELATLPDWHRRAWEKSVSDVMQFLVAHRIRHGVEALVDTLVSLPAELMTEDALVSFVKTMCCPVGKKKAALSRTASDQKVRRCGRVLGTYLLAGGVGRWQAHVLEAGLREAVQKASGAAAEVFLSAPWSVAPSADDEFSLAIVAALLAPGEKEVLATGARFDKRKRGEGVEGETE